MNKTDQNELISLVRRITVLLEHLSIHYHLTGGIVSTFYGEPRYTQDIDIVIQLEPEKVEDLIHALEEDYYINPSAITEAVQEKRLFQALDNETFIKVDFHVGAAIPGELSRSQVVDLFPDVRVKIASIEDAIVSKLRWIKLGSHRGRDDVLGILRSEHPIDFNLVRSLSQEIEVLGLLNELIQLL